MRLGIISDTHDNLRKIAQAVELFNREEVDLVLHAGDFVSPFTAREFERLQARLIGVFGNNDGDKLYLLERYQGIGELHEDHHELELNGRRIVLMHQPKLLEALIASRKYDVIIYGHTHEVDLSDGPPLVLNPGEASGWLTGRATVALL
ncbi:TPA: metallophosphoesterase, partial [Candidatus Bipolaricaulota bacterium]|nr:metallophosphoesterase [Candidatus Bipolaricaulota bacterium]